MLTGAQVAAAARTVGSVLVTTSGVALHSHPLLAGKTPSDALPTKNSKVAIPNNRGDRR